MDRNKIANQYRAALEDGDLDRVGQILKLAETDAELEALLLKEGAELDELDTAKAAPN